MTQHKIWFHKNVSCEDIQKMNKQTIGELIGLQIQEIGNDFVSATMPVDHRTHQPYGLLHGGASCVLAETLGSVASFLVVDADKYLVLGIEINANHIRSVKSGFVKGIAKPIHLGSTIHVWDIKILDENEKLVCISRLTVAIKKKS